MANGASAKAASKPRGEGFFSKIGNFWHAAGRFLRECWNETFHKSSWPSRVELRQFTTVVIVAVVAVAIWIGGIDLILRKFTEYILSGK